MLKDSIKKYLLVYLLLGLSLVTTLAIMGNVYLEHHNFQRKLDFELEISAHTIASFLQGNPTTASLNQAQKKLETLPNAIRATYQASERQQKHLNLLIQSQQLQIWDSNNRLILHSYAAPTIPLEGTRMGFSDAWQDNVAWRTYTLYLPQEGYRIIILQRQDFRLEIEKQITEDSITILVIASPFLALLIWLIVGRALGSLNSTTQSIRRRRAKNLKAISTRNVPSEIIPMIDELNRLFFELNEALEREKRFAANAAHELRTPMAALLAQAQVALKATSLDDAKNALNKVMVGANRSTHVVEQLLTLSHMTGQRTYPFTTVDLRHLCQNIITELLHQADKKKITLSLICEDQPYKAKGNEGILLIMLRNLLDNAIRYTPEKGAVQMMIKQHQSSLTLHIIDTGPGLSKTNQKRAFERFFRVLGSKQQGSGLGLAIAKQIIDLHQADIALRENNETKGLEVILTFYDKK